MVMSGPCAIFTYLEQLYRSHKDHQGKLPCSCHSITCCLTAIDHATLIVEPDESITIRPAIIIISENADYTMGSHISEIQTDRNDSITESAPRPYSII